MISIPLIKQHNLNLYQAPSLKSPAIQEQASGEKQTTSLGQTYPAIYFTGNFKSTKENAVTIPLKPRPIIDNSRPIMTAQMRAHLDKIYHDYETSLHEISKLDIARAVKNLEQTTNYSRGEILKAMQQATQFGNFNSIKVISKALKDNHVGTIELKPTENERIFNDQNFGLNRAMHYLINKKGMGDLYNGEDFNVALFLDINSIRNVKPEVKKSTIENLKLKRYAKPPETPATKYFILSGFDKGINFLDRSKDLETVTLEFLKDKDTDKELKYKLKKLGKQPIVIKNENPQTIEGIYNQLKPEKMSEKELSATIDAALLTVFPFSQYLRNNAKDDVLQYVDNSLIVFTPETISKNLTQMHNQILKFNAERGREPKDIIYCIIETEKSFDLVNYQMQHQHKIPSNQFINFNELLHDMEKPYINNKTIVFLDDCSISGASLADTYLALSDLGFNYEIPDSDIVFAPIYITKNAHKNIQETMEKLHRTHKDKIIYGTKETKNWSDNIKDLQHLNQVIGRNIFSISKDRSKPCIIYPYMAPDNNCEFAASLALLHDITHNEPMNSCDRETYLKRIQSYSYMSELIHILTRKLLNNVDLDAD